MTIKILSHSIWSEFVDLSLKRISYLPLNPDEEEQECERRWCEVQLKNIQLLILDSRMYMNAYSYGPYLRDNTQIFLITLGKLTF